MTMVNEEAQCLYSRLPVIYIYVYVYLFNHRQFPPHNTTIILCVGNLSCISRGSTVELVFFMSSDGNFDLCRDS